ncbi:MAG: element excision factor XisH family protein [Chloroflexota bacterium]
MYDESLYFRVGDVKAYIDIGAEKVIIAEKGMSKIAVEVKSFIGESNMPEFQRALGQYIEYNTILELKEPDRILYLAVPKDVYDTFFAWPLIQQITQGQAMKFLVYDEIEQGIVQWIN